MKCEEQGIGRMFSWKRMSEGLFWKDENILERCSKGVCLKCCMRRVCWKSVLGCVGRGEMERAYSDGNFYNLFVTHQNMSGSHDLSYEINWTFDI